jgi:hypothetical protein
VNWFTGIRQRLGYYDYGFLPFIRSFTLKTIWFAIFAAAFVFCEPGFAQKLVDPNAVAPEYREAAEKRRAEQIRQRDCARKVDQAKVLPRDRTEHINKCLEEAVNATTAAAAH